MKSRLFSFAAVAALIALQLSALPSQARTGAAYQGKEFKRTVELESGGDFLLSSDKGSVRLTSWDNNQVEISARIDPPQNVSEDYGRRAVEGARIEVLGGGRSLTVRSNFDGVPYRDGLGDRSKTLPDIHYEIRAPRSLNVTVELDRSKLDIGGFRGKLKLETDRTSLKASDLEGDLRINMDRGQAELSNLRGSLDIQTDRTDSTLRSVRIEGDSRLEIDRGVFEMGLTGSQQLTINADFSRRTSFESDFGVAMKTTSGKSFQGAINGGGPRFSINADRGRISLKRE
ncbi:MAG TPA: hypothetical protein VJZ26_18575 [Blastocatellia bacterium]|nr:hypothetical protein [Blastocatellia bacterium]